MNNYFMVPLLVGLVISFTYVPAAYWYFRKTKFPHKTKLRRFEGPNSAFVTAGIGSVLLPLVPIILSGAIMQDPVSSGLLKAISALFALASLVGFYVYSGLKLKKVDRSKTITLESPLLIGLNGMVFGLVLCALTTIVVFLFISPVLGTDNDATPEPIETEQSVINNKQENLQNGKLNCDTIEIEEENTDVNN